MKKLSAILIALFSLGACMLSPLTPPPPATDWSTPENKEILDDLIKEVNDLNLDLNGQNVTLAENGDLKMPKESIPEEYRGLLPAADADGNVVLDLHSIETVIKKNADGTTTEVKQILYKSGDSYVAAVYEPGPPKKIVVKNSPTIDYGTIDWDSVGGIFEATDK